MSMDNSYVLQLTDRKFQDLYLAFCGYEKCRPGHSYGPAVRQDYIIHYIVEGRGFYRVGGMKYELSAGQGFLLPPNMQTFYKADEDEPWTYLWIGINGTKAKEYLNDIGLGKKQLTYHCGYGDELKAIAVKMLRHNTFSTADQFLLEGLMYQFLSVLSRHIEIPNMCRQKDDNLYVRKALEFIHDNYANPIKITDIADYVCITRNYLYTLFKNSLNISPHEYLTNYRIEHAAELLTFTDYSVESVALSCGYKDPVLFARAFKLKKQLNPSNYRRRAKYGELDHLRSSSEALNDLDK